MLVAGAGAGLLNGETAKVMQGAAPTQRAGMASGLAATTRFARLLLGVAGLGAVLLLAVTRRFASASRTLGLDPNLVTTAGKRIAAGYILGVIGAVPEALREQTHEVAAAAFASGFSAASFVAAVVSAFTGILAL